MLILSDNQVSECITMLDGIYSSAKAFYLLSNNLANIPNRLHIPIEDIGSTLIKPAQTDTVLGMKIVSVRPNNVNLNLATVPATVILLDRITGLTQCIMNATYLTGLRTAAGSALATALFSKDNSEILTIIGAGLQAQHHIIGCILVRPAIKQVNIINRSNQRAQTLIDKLKSIYQQIKFNLIVCDLENSNNTDKKIEDANYNLACNALLNSDIICCCTNASKPVLLSSQVKSGTHINAIGSYTLNMQEVDSKLVTNCRIIIDCEQAWISGDLNEPLKQGTINKTSCIDSKECGYCAEIGQLLPQQVTQHKTDHSNNNHTIHIAPTKQLRNNPNDITLFKSVGTAIQDVITAEAVYIKAQKMRIGQSVEL